MKRKQNDIVYTKETFAVSIINHFASQFKSDDSFLDPTAGNFAFYNNFPTANKEYCEISENKDFLQYNKKADWIISNLPWSSKQYRKLFSHCCEVSNNVVQLIRIHNALGTYARHNDFLKHNHKIKEIIVVKWEDAFENKSKEGFALIVLHTQRFYNGNVKLSYNLTNNNVIIHDDDGEID